MRKYDDIPKKKKKSYREHFPRIIRGEKSAAATGKGGHDRKNLKNALAFLSTDVDYVLLPQRLETDSIFL